MVPSLQLLSIYLTRFPVSVFSQTTIGCKAEQQRRAKNFSVMAITDPAVEIVKDAIIALFGGPITFEYPKDVHTSSLYVTGRRI